MRIKKELDKLMGTISKINTKTNYTCLVQKFSKQPNLRRIYIKSISGLKTNLIDTCVYLDQNTDENYIFLLILNRDLELILEKELEQQKPFVIFRNLIAILIIFLTFSCHFVTPDECKKLCVNKGVKHFSNICTGLIYNGCICKSTHIETENKGYKIKIEELKKN